MRYNYANKANQLLELKEWKNLTQKWSMKKMILIFAILVTIKFMIEVILTEYTGAHNDEVMQPFHGFSLAILTVVGFYLLYKTTKNMDDVLGLSYELTVS